MTINDSWNSLKSKAEFDKAVGKEEKLEVLHDDRAKMQFRDIWEMSDVIGTLQFPSKLPPGSFPPVVTQWSKRFSNHVNWLNDEDDEFACHHSRYVRIFAEALSILGYLSPEYRNRAVAAMESRVAASHEPSSRYMNNIRERIADVRQLAVTEVQLPAWISPAEAAKKARELRKLEVFEDVGDILETVRAARSR